MWYRNAQADKDLGRGRKRNTRLEAKEEGERSLENRIEQPPRKKRKRDKHGQQAWEIGQTLIWNGCSISRIRTIGPGATPFTPLSFGVLVRKQTLRQSQNTVQAGMSLYQSVQKMIMYSQILFY